MDQIRDRKPVGQGIFHLGFSHSSSAVLCLSPGSFLQLQLEVAYGFEAITRYYLMIWVNTQATLKTFFFRSAQYSINEHGLEPQPMLW